MQEPPRLKARLMGDDRKLPMQTPWKSSERKLRIAEEIGVIETAFAEEPFRIDGEPAPVIEIENIAVVNVAMQDDRRTGSGKEKPRSIRAGPENAPVDAGCGGKAPGTSVRAVLNPPAAMDVVHAARQPSCR